MSTWWRSFLAVMWAFVGLRRGAESEQDSVKVTPLQLMVIGFVLCGVFVAGLMFLVKWVVTH